MMAEEEFEKWVEGYFDTPPEVKRELRENPVYRQLWCSGYNYRNKEVDQLKKIIDRLKSGQAKENSTLQ
jgi:thymidylate synthase